MKLFAFLLVIALCALAAPPQIKSIEYSYSQTKIGFWYPTFIKIDGDIKFQDVIIDSYVSTEGQLGYDTLRGVRYLCGAKYCGKIDNEIRKSWLALNEKLSVTNAQLGVDRGKKNAELAKLLIVDETIRGMDCVGLNRGPDVPPFACAPDEQSEMAWTACAVREVGPKLCEIVAKDEMGDKMPKFLTNVFAR